MPNLNTFLIKERIAVMKLVDASDIFDPNTGIQVGVAREEPSAWAKTAKENAQPRRLTTREE